MSGPSGRSDEAEMREFWEFYEPRWRAIADGTVSDAARFPAWATLFTATSPEELGRQQAETFAAQGRAFRDGLWDEYFEVLRARGEQYANSGIGFADWFDLVDAYRASIHRELLAAVDDDPASNLELVRAVAAGTTALTDAILRRVGETYLRRTEEQLRHAQKMEAIGRLAGGVAHDFNNVLTVIQSYACLLEETIGDDADRREEIAAIRRAASRATSIARQLLTVSRRRASAPRTVDLGDLVRGFVPMLGHLVGESVQVVLVPNDVGGVVVDPGQLEQVLMNLAVNARDAMPNGGRLTIEWRLVDAGRHVELAITDTGAGMDAATQRRIFEPFFTTKEAGKGTGLGLSIVQGIVEAAGGTVSVYSELGVGTTFRVQLPVAEQSARAAEPPPLPAPRELPRLRVLVVEHQADVRTVAARVLRDAGCEVLEAGTAEEARRICVSDERTIDLVLVDVILPDGRADELVPQLRALRPGLKFVHMSGYPAGALGGGDAPVRLLAKPFTPAELRTAIAQVCAPGERTRASPTAERKAARGGRRVLVVDDDGAVRRMIARGMRGAGFTVQEADSGFAAISVLEREPVDVVISDVHMPDGSGLDLLRSVRRVDLDVPVILITGEPSVAAAAEAVEMGAFRFLTKPADLDALVKTVEHAARAHALARLRREAYRLSGGLTAGAVDRAGLEVRFEQALERLSMVYQPIVHATTGALFGIEALLRTGEPSMPTATPVLDAAVALGRLPVLGRRVRAIVADGVRDTAASVAVFVNLHPDDLWDAELLGEAAPLTQIAPRVILEITERASLTASAAIADRIARLRRLGFRIAVDDIGAGYSGLASFAELTPEIVKIDMSLVRNVHTSGVKQRTIGALCDLCHEVGTLVVGEGVETVEERDTLVDLGCDLLQGFLLGVPVPQAP